MARCREGEREQEGERILAAAWPALGATLRMVGPSGYRTRTRSEPARAASDLASGPMVRPAVWRRLGVSRLFAARGDAGERPNQHVVPATEPIAGNTTFC